MVRKLLHRYKHSSKHSKMAMRLYHRRASTSKDRLQVFDASCPTNSLIPQGRKDSLGANRPRSLSLFPGSNNSLVVPPRSRSLSFSGPSKGPECYLTASEEENIFRCYTRVMYILLGGLVAAVMGLILYGVHSFAKF